MLESIPGRGSTFTLYIPNVQTAAAVNLIQPSGGMEPQYFESRTVLVVDDIDSNCSMIAAMLAEVGLAAVIATNGAIGVAKAREIMPDLILMDIRMPVMDGFEAAATLRGDAVTAKIPIVAVTASI